MFNEQAQSFNNGDRTAMLPSADARAYGMTSALRRGFNKHEPRTTTIALTDCIVTRADLTQYVIARNTRRSSGATKKYKAAVRAQVIKNNDILLQARMSSIHV